MNLWISRRERLLRKGVPIETFRIREWINSSKSFNSSVLDWKGREVVEHETKSSRTARLSHFGRIFKSRWEYREGSPVRVTSEEFAPKRLLYSPESFTKAERKFFSRSFQVVPNEITSFHIGKFPAKFGSRPNKFSYPDEVTMAYFYQRGISQGNPYLNSPRNYVHVSGTWDTNFHTIQRQMDTGKESPGISSESYKKWRPSLRASLSKLGAVELSCVPSERDIDSVELSGDTYSGCRWDKFFGLSTKLRASGYAREVARELFRKTSRQFTPSDSLWTIGGREAREDECLVEEGDVTSRGVHMPEVHEEILNFLWSRPVEKFFHSKADGPIWLGHSFNDGGWKRLKRNLDFSSSVIEGDWKKFDSSVSEEKIVIAMAIIRSFYPRERWIDRHFLRITDQLVFKNYVTPGGLMFRMCSGIPSGSAFTALLNSVVNFICLNRVCYEKLGLRRRNSYRLAIGGDDFLIFLRRPKGAIEEVVEYSLSELGMELKENSKWTCPYPDRILDSPSFYKNIIYNGLPTIRPDHLYERLLAPNSIVKRGWAPERYLNTLFASPPFLFGHLEWLVHLIAIYSKRNLLPMTHRDIVKLLKLRFERTALFSDKELEKISSLSNSGSQKRERLQSLSERSYVDDKTLKEAKRCFRTWDHKDKLLIGRRLMIGSSSN